MGVARGGGGPSRSAPSRSPSMSRPSSSRPSSRPSTGATRPSPGGARPSTGATRPSAGGTRPNTGATRPSTGGSRPSTGGRPSQGTGPTGGRPSQGQLNNFLDLGGPSTGGRPGQQPSTRPSPVQAARPETSCRIAHRQVNSQPDLEWAHAPEPANDQANVLVLVNVPNPAKVVPQKTVPTELRIDKEIVRTGKTLARGVAPI